MIYADKMIIYLCKLRCFFTHIHQMDPYCSTGLFMGQDQSQTKSKLNRYKKRVVHDYMSFEGLKHVCITLWILLF